MLKGVVIDDAQLLNDKLAAMPSCAALGTLPTVECGPISRTNRRQTIKKA